MHQCEIYEIANWFEHFDNFTKLLEFFDETFHRTSIPWVKLVGIFKHRCSVTSMLNEFHDGLNNAMRIKHSADNSSFVCKACRPCFIMVIHIAITLRSRRGHSCIIFVDRFRIPCAVSASFDEELNTTTVTILEVFTGIKTRYSNSIDS